MRQDLKITIDFQLSPVFDDNGQVTHLIPSGFDVTERNQALDHAQMLMEEVNHRSKNVLSLVQAIARQTVRSSPEDFLLKFSDRISALARAQDLLVKANWNSVDLSRLVESQLEYFEDAFNDRIHFSGPAVVVTAQAAQSLSMILHELATNAGKYGALSNSAGRVEIDWTVDSIDGKAALSLTWQESGGPLVVKPSRTGFGSVLMTTLIESTFNASAEISYHPEGVVWRLVRGKEGIIGA
jgi:two-component sensor histidine kinase